MRIFVINGHKYYWYATGKLNCTLFREIVDTLMPHHEVKSTIVELGYCVEEEIEKYRWADIIIYQTPINWFSVPWLLKKYFDEVFLSKIFFDESVRYGEGGLFFDKKYMFSLTCAAKESDFNNTDGFFDVRGIDELFLPLHKMHQFCSMRKIETFCAYDVIKNPQIERLKDRLRYHLNKYINHFL